MATHTLAARTCLRWLTVSAIILIAAVVGFSQGVVIQLVPFLYPNGSEVVSVNGEPLDGALNRFTDTQKERIYWAVMSQHLEPGEEYDIWLEGGSFSWWVGSAKATAQGKLNATGIVHVGQPLGPASGAFTDASVAADLVIRTTGGTTLQTASFPGI